MHGNLPAAGCPTRTSAPHKHTIPIKFVDKDEAQKRVNFAVDDGFKLDETSSEAVVNPGSI